MATYGYIRTSRDQEPDRPGMNPDTQRRDLLEGGVPERNIHADIDVSGVAGVATRNAWRSLVIASRDGAAYIEILAEPAPQDWSLIEFTESHRLKVLQRAVNWELYYETSISGEFRGATNFVHQEFRRRGKPSSCVENVVSHFYRSRFFPARLTGFVRHHEHLRG